MLSQPSERDLGDRAAETGARLIGSLAGGGAEIVKGIYATAWTGVPFTLLLLGELEVTFPGITTKFLAGLSLFINALAGAAEQALASFGKGISNLPNENSSGTFCVRIKSAAGVESHKCYTLAADRDKALSQLISEDLLHLETITPYDIAAGTTLYCVRYSGYLNTPGNQCFATDAERQTFITVGLGTHRIANPVTYETKT